MPAFRVFAASIQQETNSLSVAVPTLTDFDRLTGDAAMAKLSLEPLDSPEVTLIPGTYAHAVPSGRLPRAVFDTLLGELLEALPADPDGIFLYLHGALDVEHYGSGDAEITRAVRERVGRDVKISVAMDFHANVSPVLIEHADIVCAYRTAPHVDMEETQRRGCALLLELLRRGKSPAACLMHLPMLFTGDCVITENEPAKSLMMRQDAIQKETGALQITTCFGQPWVDTRWVGPSVTAYADDLETARDAAGRVAKLWWDARAEFRFLTETCMPEHAFDIARKSEKKPVFLSDSGDNTTAGAAGDRAGMLNLALTEQQRILIAGLTDAPAVEQAYRIGAGGRAEFTLGGTLDHTHADVCQGMFEVVSLGQMLGWYGEDAGRRALLRHGTVDVIVTENRCAVISPEIIRTGGADVFAYDEVVVKLGYLYPALAEIAPRAVFVMTEGASTARVETIRYQNVPLPVYPADPETRYDGVPALLKK